MSGDKEDAVSIDREDVAVADTAGRGGDSLSLEGVDLRGAAEHLLDASCLPDGCWLSQPSRLIA